MAVFRQTAFLTFATVSSVYRIIEADLDPPQLVLVGTVFEATVFLFEVPTGIVADVYSRKLSLIIGFAFMGAGFILEGALPIFAAILAAQVVWGIGYTFTSGARQAWLADELGDNAETSRVFVRAARFELVGSLVGIGLSVALASIFVSLSLLVGDAMFLALSLAIAMIMPERGFRGAPPRERKSWSSTTGTLRSGLSAVRGSRVLKALIVIELFYGMSSEPFDRLWSKHILDNFTFPGLAGFDPVVWFGIVEAFALFLGLGVIWWVERTLHIEAPGVRRIVLSLTNALTMGASLIFAPTKELWSGHRHGGRCLGSENSRRTNGRRLAEPECRIFSQGYCVFPSRTDQLARTGALGPGMGALASGFGLRYALVGVALLLVPATGDLRLSRIRFTAHRPGHLL